MHTKAVALFFAALTLALAGCGTSPTPIGLATEVPPKRVLAKIPDVSPNHATLTLVRDSGFQGVEHVFEFWVNGLQVAELRAGEKFTTPIDPGTAILEIRMFNVFGKIAPVQVETVLAPGKSYVYRAGLDGTLRLHLTRDLELSN